ncbi:MAG: RrF2 family transcriptional regulator [Candidatus Gastranaerophilaceae bacterium]|jgi:Rrf2 family protein|nr:Rrf2 family transcriptional regulator [Christensenellales bacterium]
MLLCITTDYAIRCMLQLAICSKICIASEVADAMSIPLSNLRKVIRLLKEAHLIETHQGQNGGILLMRPSDEITLKDIMVAMGEDIHINRCVKEDHFCNRNAVGKCPVHRLYDDLQRRVDATLELTLHQIITSELDSGDLSKAVSEKINT